MVPPAAPNECVRIVEYRGGAQDVLTHARDGLYAIRWAVSAGVKKKIDMRLPTTNGRCTFEGELSSGAVFQNMAMGIYVGGGVSRQR